MGMDAPSQLAPPMVFAVFINVHPQSSVVTQVAEPRILSVPLSDHHKVSHME